MPYPCNSSDNSRHGGSSRPYILGHIFLISLIKKEDGIDPTQYNFPLISTIVSRPGVLGDLGDLGDLGVLGA